MSQSRIVSSQNGVDGALPSARQVRRDPQCCTSLIITGAASLGLFVSSEACFQKLSRIFWTSCKVRWYILGHSSVSPVHKALQIAIQIEEYVDCQTENSKTETANGPREKQITPQSMGSDSLIAALISLAPNKSIRWPPLIAQNSSGLAQYLSNG